MRPVTICFTYFKSLTLENLDASLYSVSRQDMSGVDEIVVVDNDSPDSERAIQEVIAAQRFAVPVRLVSVKHGTDAMRGHAWSTNYTVRRAWSPWVFYTRADYLLDFSMLGKFLAVVRSKPEGWEGFIVSHGCHLSLDVKACEASPWRERGPRIFSGVEYDYTEIDAGVWMTKRDTYERVGGMNEKLSAWGHSQTEFQHRIYEAGVEFVRLKETLFFHPHHGAERDIDNAHRQLEEVGGDLKQMWKRYHGESPYR